MYVCVYVCLLVRGQLYRIMGKSFISRNKSDKLGTIKETFSLKKVCNGFIEDETGLLKKKKTVPGVI